MTTNEYYARIALARKINSVSFGAVIAPWDVDQLDEVWKEAFRLLASDGQRFVEAKQEIANVKSAWLARHPTYGK
jgi:hypothetical protein